MFTPILGEMIQFDEHIFQLGWFNHQLPVVRFFMSLFFWRPLEVLEEEEYLVLFENLRLRGCDRWQGPGDIWGGEMKSETLRVEI